MSDTNEKLYKIQDGQLVEVEPSVAQEPIHKKAYGMEEARKIIGLGRGKFGELLRSGQIKGIKAGSKWIIPVWAIDDFLGKAN